MFNQTIERGRRALNPEVFGSNPARDRGVEVKRILIVFLIAAFSFVGCGANEKNYDKYVPTRATLVENLGSGWIIFDLDGNNYLYHSEFGGYSARECITKM